MPRRTHVRKSASVAQTPETFLKSPICRTRAQVTVYTLPHACGTGLDGPEYWNATPTLALVCALLVEEQAALNARHLYIHKTPAKAITELIFLLRAERAPVYRAKRGDFCTGAVSQFARGTIFFSIERLTSQ